jgi:hypothetical protein
MAWCTALFVGDPITTHPPSNDATEVIVRNILNQESKTA